MISRSQTKPLVAIHNRTRYITDILKPGEETRAVEIAMQRIAKQMKIAASKRIKQANKKFAA